MRGDRAAGLRALLLLLSRAAALDPSGLFPYGQFRGDQLLKEGDDESSAAVKLASPLRFYEAQFSYLYVSSAPPVRDPAGFPQLLPRGPCSAGLPEPCLPRGGNSAHALRSPSAPGVGPGFAAMLLRDPLLSLPPGREPDLLAAAGASRQRRR